MRAQEFVSEGKTGKINKSYSDAMPGAYNFRDNGTDRIYNLNRIMMAAAMADGKSHKAVDMDAASWADKYNTAHPYSKEEDNMMHQAFATVKSNLKHQVSDHRSVENSDVHRVSPVKGFKGYTR